MRKDDVAFYVDLACEATRPVLELGCGTGRVLIPSAIAGARITGLDQSELMLDLCKRKLAAQPADVQSRATLRAGDMTDFNLGERFALITIPFRPFQHLVTVDEQLACLRCARKHLADNGRLVFDVFKTNMQFATDPSGSEEKEDCPPSPLPDGGTVRRTARRAEIHLAEQWMLVEFNYYIEDGSGHTERLTESFPMRYFFRYEVEHLLALAGLEVVDLYGDFKRSAFGDDSPEMIFVAKKTTKM